MGRVKSKRRRAESQRIVAARPLCLLQYPVAYLSRLQRILLAARWELNFKAAGEAHLPHRPLLLVGKRAASACIASSPDSDLEAFSHNPAHAVHRQPTGSGLGPPCPALRANPFPEVTDPFCRLPLPTLFHRPEAVHLGDLMRL
ncbi:hypothetical protein DCAR_0622709 [Daucus carota subsp. sativus]|uniref:Uncharacterized protein n=1 Tax=Daucus carota subsp. sativus TaxID=79200 RepID=A0AAF0X8P1_DAUCS|nr:hypothetical protein DCAR_0622709 [Daucus carota subsp. sativus]